LTAPDGVLAFTTWTPIIIATHTRAAIRAYSSMVTPDLFFEKREMIVFIVSSPGGA
jgi:hypothetical protein